MKKHLILILILLRALVILSAETIILNNMENNVELISSNDRSCLLELKLASFEKESYIVNGKEFFKISVDKEAETYQKGAPELPVISRSVIIDKTSKPELKILSSEYKEFKINVISSRGIIKRNVDLNSIPYEFGPIYNQDSFYPSQLASLNTPFVMRNYRGVTVSFNPFQYNPKTGILRVYSSIIVEVINTQTSGENKLISQASNLSSFQSLYKNHFLNFEEQRYEALDEFGSILVIAPQNFISTMQIYANWKIQKGIPTQIIDVANIGNNSTSIKNYIQEYYDNHPDLAFVQIAGDAAQVASLTSEGGGADPKYALLAGNDNYPDIFVGRFSAENVSQLLTQVERTLNYERDLNSSATYLTKAMGVASAEGGGSQGDNGESDITHMNIIRTNLLNYNYTYVDQIYDPGASASNVANAINDGRGHVNYVGHGSTTSWSTTGFSTSDINNLTNVNELPFIVSVACVNGNFVSYTCFAEAWMRATYNDQATGAMVIYASSINQSWNSPMYGQDHINQLLTSESLSTVGALYYSGACAMMDAYGSDGQDMYNTWHIFGDASLQVRTDIPESMLINHSGILPSGTTSYSVNTGVENALVSLSYNNQIIGSGYSNSSGSVNLNLSNLPTSPSDLTLTVTAFNKITVVEPVTMSAVNGPYLTLAEYSINDANNNDLLEYGESATLNLVIENIGTQTSSSGTITFSESDPYLNLSTNSTPVNAISPEASLNINNVIHFTIADNVPNNHSISLAYVITASGEDYSGNISLTAKSYDMEITQITIDDSSLGNGNNVIDAGESFLLVASITNNGEIISPSNLANIGPVDYITFTNTSDNIAPVSAGGQTSVSFTATASNSIPAGELISFTVSTDYPNGSNQLSQDFLAALLQIGHGTVTDAHLPIEAYYGYTYSQSIYTSSELNLGVSQINKIAYQYNGNSAWTDDIVIYMGNTDKNSFTSSTDWISLDNLTQVYSGSFSAPATTGWVEIELSSPFTYDGTSNLVIAFDENTSGYHASGDEFYCYTSGSNRSIYYYNDYTNPNPASPVSGTVTGNNPNIRIFAVSTSTEPVISLNTTSIDLGQVIIGDFATRNLTISNIGGQTLTGNINVNNSFTITETRQGISKNEIMLAHQGTRNIQNFTFSISSGTSQSYDISHPTQDAGRYSGNLRITSNDPDSPEIDVPLALEVKNPANINVNPQALSLNLQPEQTSDRSISISNTGDFDLNCSLSLDILDERDIIEIFSANFDDHDLSAWTIDYLSSAEDTWHITDAYNYYGTNFSLDETAFLFIDSDTAGSNVEFDDTIESPLFNISNYEEITIEFDHYFNSWSDEIADVDLWTGSEWINIASWQGDDIGSWSSPSHFSHTLANEGYGDVKLRFHYYNAIYEYYWAIDNLLVTGQGSPAPQWVTLDNQFSSLTIVPETNQGVILNFSSLEFTPGEYTANLNIQSNSATNSNINIPITLTISELVNEPDWQPVIYPNNTATIYAEVTHLSDEIASDDIVSAWVGGECRGLGEIVIVNRSQAFTTILVQSNGSLENVSFKLYDRSADLVIEESNSTPVASGQVVGSAQEPFPINIGVIELIAPNNLNVQISNSLATINWLSVPNADFYKVYYSSDLSNWIELGDTNDTFYQHNQIRSNSEAYFYKVKAMKD